MFYEKLLPIFAKTVPCDPLKKIYTNSANHARKFHMQKLAAPP